MKKNKPYYLITFFKFINIADPQAEVKAHLRFCQDIGMKGRIYIGEEGISATASCNTGQLAAYQLFLKSNPYFDDVEEQIIKKISLVSEHMFEKMIVKYRPEIVALGHTIDAADYQKSVQNLSVDQLKQVIDNNEEDRVILDMRNSYEYKLGHFKNAIPAGTINFREVEELIDEYQEQFQDKKVLMYCTGGIRCDKLSVMLKKKGLENFYGLEDGVVNYINTHNDGNRLGNLYTFDGVISKQVGDDNTHTTIGKCIYSDLPTDNAENCRYSPCNARILARKKHYKRYGGFCSQGCFQSAQQDGLIKKDSFDPLDYKALRGKVKSWKLTQSDFIAQVVDHLEKIVSEKNYPHAASQKEALIDKEYLAQWFNIN